MRRSRNVYVVRRDEMHVRRVSVQYGCVTSSGVCCDLPRRAGLVAVPAPPRRSRSRRPAHRICVREPIQGDDRRSASSALSVGDEASRLVEDDRLRARDTRCVMLRSSARSRRARGAGTWNVSVRPVTVTAERARRPGRCAVAACAARRGAARRRRARRGRRRRCRPGRASVMVALPGSRATATASVPSSRASTTASRAAAPAAAHSCGADAAAARGMRRARGGAGQHGDRDDDPGDHVISTSADRRRRANTPRRSVRSASRRRAAAGRARSSRSAHGRRTSTRSGARPTARSARARAR